MSSSTWASQMAQGGIFDTANSAFGNANRIYVKYCSSDLWSGDVAASSATFNFAFRGARSVSAVMTALVEQHGMSGPGNRLLFGGCSAGAIGAMNNLDAVAAQLASTGVEVKGLLDAAALVDIYPAAWPFSPDLIPLQTLVEELVYTIQPTFPASCAAKGYTGPAQWKCLWSAYRLPLVETPFFANAVQFDDFEIQYSTDNLGPSNPQQMEFVNSFQPAFLNLINSLPPGSGVFSPTCLVHCLSGQNTYFEFYVNGETMSRCVIPTAAASPFSSHSLPFSPSALNAWYFDGQPTSVVSSCTGWACTAQCGVTSKGTPCNMALSTKTQTCQAVSLPTTETDEPPPATEDAVQLLPAAWYAQQQAQEQQQGQVQQSEGSLSPAQQQQLQSVVQQHQQQQQGRRMLAAATRSCCGAE